MKEYDQEMTRVTLTRKKQLVSFDINEDDELNIDTKSSTDSEKTFENVIESRLHKKILRELSSNGKNIKQNIDLWTSKIEKKDIPKAVYDYATMIHQNRFDQDITTILGSSDPPPGFGILHPPMHYLKQERPFPLEPLPVWRGYNGNVYFSPIQVQHFQNDRPQLRRNLDNDQSDAILSSTHNNRKLKKETMTNEDIEDQEPTKPWHSTLPTSSHTRLKPILISNQLPEENQHREKTFRDSLKHKRQVLPNIRSVPKPKLIHKGLAFKEGRKLSGLTNEINTNPIQHTSNPHESHVQHTNLLTRTKRTNQQSSFIPITKDQASIDLREIRKRIIKGTTTPFRTPTQSMAWSSNPFDHKSLLNSEIFPPIQMANSSNHITMSSVSPQHHFKHNAAYTTPNLSQYFDVFPMNTNINIS